MTSLKLKLRPLFIQKHHKEIKIENISHKLVEDIHHTYSEQYSEYIKNSYISIRKRQATLQKKKKNKRQKTQALTRTVNKHVGKYPPPYW